MNQKWARKTKINCTHLNDHFFSWNFSKFIHILATTTNVQSSLSLWWSWMSEIVKINLHHHYYFETQKQKRVKIHIHKSKWKKMQIFNNTWLDFDFIFIFKSTTLSSSNSFRSNKCLMSFVFSLSLRFLCSMFLQIMFTKKKQW